MKKMKINNGMLKLLSLVIAIIIWICIVNIDNPMEEKFITGIPVEIINADTLSSNKMTFDVKDGGEATIYVSGRRSIVSRLTRNDFVAQADMSKLTELNTLNVNVKLLNSNNSIKIKTDSVVKIAREHIVTKEFTITAVSEGDTSPGYIVASISVNPDIIEIEGPESIVNSIHKVILPVKVTGANADMLKKDKLVLYDGNSKEISKEKLNLTLDEAEAKITVYKAKNLPIKIVGDLVAAPDYAISKIALNPSTITVSGPDDIISKLTSIEVPVEDLNIGNGQENFEQIVELYKYLKDGVFIVDSSGIALLNVDIEQEQEKELNLRYSDLEVLNKDNDFKYSLKENMDIKVVGLQNNIDKITSVRDLTPSINVLGLEPGDNTVVVSMTLPEGVKVPEDFMVDIVVEEK